MCLRRNESPKLRQLRQGRSRKERAELPVRIEPGNMLVKNVIREALQEKEIDGIP